MKLKHKIQIIEMEDNFLVVPFAGDDFQGVLRVNYTSVAIIKCLEENVTEDEIVKSLMKEFDVTDADARSNIQKVITTLKDNNLLIE